ncbi:hypothetical protein MSS2_02609 [Mycobacterium marinum]|nr:hypothetical protein MSS2_02609 [Mycobacterium marinum]
MVAVERGFGMTLRFRLQRPPGWDRLLCSSSDHPNCCVLALDPIESSPKGL